MSLRMAVLAGVSLVSAAALARTEDREVGAFSSVHVASGIYASVEIGPRRPAKIEADDEVLPYVELRMEGDELHVGFKPHTSFRSEHRVRVTLQTPELRAVSGSGGSEVRATLTRGNEAGIQASGGSVMKVRGADVARLRVQASGGSVLDVAGSADALDLQLSGGSQLHGRDLEVKDVDVQASGGSGAELRADGRIRGNLSGGSQLHVRGRANTRVATSGGSEVTVDD
jgi:hypothetical protein